MDRARGLMANGQIPVDEVGDDALLAAVDRGVERPIVRIVLLRLAERGDRVLVIALRLQRLPQAALRIGVAEFEVGPRAAQLRGAAPVARAQHPRTFDLQHRDLGAALRELRGEVGIDRRRRRRWRASGDGFGAAAAERVIAPATPAQSASVSAAGKQRLRAGRGSAAAIVVRAHAIESPSAGATRRRRATALPPGRRRR